VVTIPTIGSPSDSVNKPPGAHSVLGFNVEDVQSGDSNWTLWDIGGGDKIRPLYYHCETELIQPPVNADPIFFHQTCKALLA
jgi:hypothetical protein